MDLFFTNIAYASVDSFVANVDKLIVNPLILLLFALAIVYYLFGVIEFIMHQDNEEQRAKGNCLKSWPAGGIAKCRVSVKMSRLVANPG